METLDNGTVPAGTQSGSAPAKASTSESEPFGALLLGELARKLLSDLEPGAIAPVACEVIGRGLGVDLCVLLGMRLDRLVTRSSGVYCGQGSTLSTDFSVEGAGAIVTAIRLEGELVISDVGDDPPSDPAIERLVEAFSAKALLAVPIIFSSNARAILILAMQKAPRDWTEQELAMSRDASSIISIAHRQGELLDEARRVGERETQLRQIGRALRSSLGLDHVLRMAAERISAAVRADRLTVFIWDETEGLSRMWEAGELCGEEPVRVASVDAEPALSESTVDALIAQHGPSLLDESWKQLDTVEGGCPTPDRQVLVCPIVVRGRLRGLLEIFRRQAGWLWRDGEIAFLSEIAEQLAMAIHQAQLFEQVLRSQHEWESTFDGLADAVLIYNHSCKVRRTNQAASTMVNKPLESLVGLPCCEVGLCAGAEGCAIRNAIDGRARVTIEIISKRTYHVLHVTVDPLLNENGDVIGAVQLVRDLDDLRRTEAELRRQQHFLVNLVESAHDAIFVIDLAGRLVWSNSHLTGLTGMLVSEMLGKLYTSFVSEDEQTEFEMHFQAATTGETRRFEASIYHTRNGEERRVVITYSPINEDGKVVSVLGVARDVTEEKMIAERSQQADKLRALGQLASGVAHDVNNDLAAILGRVQRLMRNRANTELRRDLEVIETAALDSAQTVRRIQNFARQQGNADFEAVDLNGLVRDAIEITRTRWLDDALSRGIKYSVDFEATELPMILGDGSQLREVFVNLIINALDAMPQGGALHVSSSRNGADSWVRFSDEGGGIPRRIRERIFEPFFSTKGASGTGMGLAVSYGIVTRHNGRIDVESEVGKGTAFTISLPLGAVRVEQPLMEPLAPVRKLRVLVIDDESVVREVLADVLEEQGHSVLQVGTGIDGLARLTEAPVDIIFTDLSMPEMDGWAVARIVRQKFPQIKIVLVTGYGVSVSQPSDQPDLVDSIIGKPFEYEDIEILLSRMFGGEGSATL